MTTRVYVSGPITGLPIHLARKAFADAAAELAARGYAPVNPMLLPAPADCRCPSATGDAGADSGHEWACYLRKDIRALVDCQAILMLPGWETSHGARLELTVASAVGLEVWWQLPPARSAWRGAAPQRNLGVTRDDIRNASAALDEQLARTDEAQRRADEVLAHAQGYADAVARLRDDERYRNWWTARPGAPSDTAYWNGTGRRHLADYLEIVGPDGIDVTTGRWPAREQAVIRAAIAWRKAAAAGDDPALWADGSDLALIEAVDALPHLSGGEPIPDLDDAGEGEAKPDGSAREAKPPRFEPGWLQRQVAESVATLDQLPPKLRASLEQPTTYRQAERRNGKLYQHPCGRVVALAEPPTAGRCAVGPIRCEYDTDDPAAWQPLYRADTQQEPGVEYVCPNCRVERADYEAQGKHLPECPNCGSTADPQPAKAPQAVTR